MIIIGCDFHPSWQQVNWLDTETGGTGERKLVQAAGEAERFYRLLPAPPSVERVHANIVKGGHPWETGRNRLIYFATKYSPR